MSDTGEGRVPQFMDGGQAPGDPVSVPDAGRILVDGRGPVLGGRLRAEPVARARSSLQDSRAARQRTAIAWIRTHAAEYGAEPGVLFVTGSSAGAKLAIRAVAEGETGIAGLICRYGYYRDLAPR